MPDCQRLRVAFAGTPEFAAVALRGLLQSDHEVVLALSQPDRPAGRGRKQVASPVKQLAVDAGVPVQQPVSLRAPEAQRALADALDASQADVMVVAAYGLILPREVLDLPPLGCLNIHGSLLPRWRGAAPIHRAILHGDEHTGICIMVMDEGLDTGDVLSRHALEIGRDETTGSLHDRLAELGSRALLDTLPAYCDGSLVAVPQPADGVSYAEKLSKSEAILDFSATALALHNRIRAFNPWPVAESTLDGERIRIWGSALSEHSMGTGTATEHSRPGTILGIDDAGMAVATGDGTLLLTTLQRSGGRALSARVFAQDRRLIGHRFGAEA